MMRDNKHLDGFSLVELLIAVSILSMVLVSGFTAFSRLQDRYITAKSTAHTINRASADADRFFINAHDNATFNADAISHWPPDNLTTPDNETVFTVTSLWGDRGGLDDNGSFFCRLASVDVAAAHFSIPENCYMDLGVDLIALTAALTKSPIPSTAIVGSSNFCIIAGVSAGDPTTFTVSNIECLTDSDGQLAKIGDDGAGVIFPRFSVDGIGKAEILSSLYFTHFGTNHSGIGLDFDFKSGWRTSNASRYQVGGSDNFTSGWVNIHQFGSNDIFTLDNPQSQTAVTLSIEALDIANTGASLSLDAGGSDNFSQRLFENRSPDNITATLRSLYINAPLANDEVDIRLKLGGGDMVWSRDLRLVIE